MNFQSNIIEIYRHNSYITLKTVDFAEMTGGGEEALENKITLNTL